MCVRVCARLLCNKHFAVVAFIANVFFCFSSPPHFFSNAEVYNFFVFFALSLLKLPLYLYLLAIVCLEFIFEFIEWKQAINRIFNEHAKVYEKFMSI